MKLIIAEKPSLGRTIASAIGAREKKKGYVEGNGYIVSWCFGHLYELIDLEKYWDKDYKKGDKVSWEESMSHLPFFPDNWAFRYEIKQGCRDQIKILKELLNRPDVDTVYAAGDADREGEVIVRLVLEANLKSNKKILRLWLPSLTDSVIRQAVKDAKPDKEYDNLYYAGKTRAAVDWMMGIELTRFASVKAHKFLRIGRCVCPIVSKIVEREKEIKDFVPETYYAVVGEVVRDDGELTLTCKQQFDKDHKREAEAYADSLNGGQTIVTEVSKKDVELQPGRLFSLSDLQSFVCKKDKTLTPADVLASTQTLYEHGHVTYPRTNSSYLCKDEADRIDGIIKVFEKEGYKLVNKQTSKHIYDDSKVESHSAITPTERIPSGLEGADKTVYECIRNRFLAVFSSTPCIVERTQYTITCKDETFKPKGDVLKQKGWQEYEPVQKKEANLPTLSKGEELHPNYKAVEKQTQPPKRFTVETLNNWMVSPMKKEDKHDDYTDEEWKDILSEATICTEATRADTIDRCIKSKYIKLEKGTYSATEFGFYLVDVMDELGIDLSVQKTVDLSRDMHDVAVGKTPVVNVLEGTKTMLTAIIRSDAVVTKSYEGEEKEEIGKCPKCGKPVYETPKAFSCSDRECKFALWKDNKYFEALGTKMTKSRASQLLNKGKFLAKGLKSKKSGKTYDAYICLDGLDERGFPKWKMEFPK